MTEQPPLPKRIAWFAPWTWKRTTYLKIVGVMLFAYSLSPGLATYLCDHTSLLRGRFSPIRGAVRDTVGPAVGLCEMLPFLKETNREEALLLRDIFGDATE